MAGSTIAGKLSAMAETSVPDPNGEDMCAFGFEKPVVGFLWRRSHIDSPTLGGNNGQAAAINNRGQIVGISETTVPDSGCPSGKQPGTTMLPVMWEKGEVRPLPTLPGKADGFVQGLNNQGQAVGAAGTCTSFAIHAVLWGKRTLPSSLRTSDTLDLDAYAINDHGQAVGYVSTTDGSTIVPSLWRNSGSQPSVFCRRWCRLCHRHQQPGPGGGKYLQLRGLVPRFYLAGQCADRPEHAGSRGFQPLHQRGL